MSAKRGLIDPSKRGLTHKERFRRQMHFRTVDRGVHWEFGYWEETVERWHAEGLPAGLVKRDGPFSVEQYFGVEPHCWIPICSGPQPPFEGPVTVLEERPGRRVEQRPDGMVVETQTEGIRTIPRYVRMPIETRDDWRRFKERLDPNHPARLAYDYRAAWDETRLCSLPVGTEMGSFLGQPRNWIGFERTAMLFYDDPALIEEIIETLTVIYETQLRRLLPEVEPDFACGGEDCCFRSGPMVSPAMFRAVVAPRIKRVCDLLHRHGVDVVWTDCDGNINQLVPIWLESGINCMFPIEVAAGSDPVALRKEYGHRILLRGGIAKAALVAGRKEILAELRRITPVFEDGGYIPHVDHRVPADVPYDHYRYYVREKLALLGWRPDEIESVEPLAGFR